MLVTLTNPNPDGEDLDLFIGNNNTGTHYKINFFKQVAWLRLISNNMASYFEKNV